MHLRIKFEEAIAKPLTYNGHLANFEKWYHCCDTTYEGKIFRMLLTCIYNIYTELHKDLRYCVCKIVLQF